jgi:ABC-2 type transport system ATP-binding protein
MEGPILKITKLNKAFGRKAILKNINLDVYQGEILGIIGASGSGKTTLLNTLIGFVQPDEGKVLFKAQKAININKEEYQSFSSNEKSVKNMYGFAAQFPSFYEKLTVKENLEYFGELYDLSKDTRKANSETLMKLMDLQNSSNVLAKNLSGGMERRLDIACAMMHNPKILILDEPTADLDPFLRNNIWNLIEKINKKGTTIILSSHHLSELETLCSRIAILKHGKILGLGTTKELKEKFAGQEELRIQSYPGDYNKIGTHLINVFPDQITKCTNKGNELLVACKEPQYLLNRLMKEIETQNERIIEIKLIHPSLDQIFINISGENK